MKPAILAILLAQAWGGIVTIWGGIIALDLKGGSTVPLADFPWVALVLGAWAAVAAATLAASWWFDSRRWAVIGLGWAACVFGGTSLALAHDGIVASAGWAACWTILAVGTRRRLTHHPAPLRVRGRLGNPRLAARIRRDA